MLNHNALQTELLNDNLDRIGGMVMNTFKKMVGLFKKVMEEVLHKYVSYSYGERQNEPVFETTESYFYMEQLIKKYKPAE